MNTILSFEILSISIILTPVVAILLVFLFRHYPFWINITTILLSLLSLIISIVLANMVLEGSPRIVNIPLLTLYLDSLSIYFVLLVNLVAFFASIYTIPFLQFDAKHNQYHNPFTFHVFLNLFHLTMLLVPMVDNLVVLWIFVELTTIFSTVLVRYLRHRLAVEASWKFMTITTTGIIFALLGTLFLARANPVLSNGQSAITFSSPMLWSELAKPENAKALEPNFVLLSFLFILIGYGTKAGLAPMHTWLPDGHGEAPSPVSALLSGVMLKSALYAILRFYTITNLNLKAHPEAAPVPNFPSQLLLAAGLLSLVLAVPFILKKNKFKRVLAYHSLEHMGIITFGIGIGTPVALFGALLHALNHAMTKSLMFLVFGSMQYEYFKASGITEDEGSIRGILKSMPISGTILAFGGLALVGMPPFNIFMSEFMILWAAFQSAGQTASGIIPPAEAQVAVIVFVVTVTLIFGGLVSHLARLLLGPSPIPTLEPNFSPLALLLLMPFVLMIIIILLFGITIPNWPVNLTQIIENSVLILQNGAK
ncbi:MAG: hypothetical protein GYA36_21060 [Veillonellaceae bacterium]|nr:hypothetical protein [Veillonellaceae bacterium]